MHLLYNKSAVEQMEVEPTTLVSVAVLICLNL